MFIEQFKLKEKSWYVKLMKYIWNLDSRDFQFICPFFWLSILNVIIILPVFLWKAVVVRLAITIIDPIDGYFTRKDKERDEKIFEQVRIIMNNIEDNDHYIKMYADWKFNKYVFKPCATRLDKKVLESMYNLYDRSSTENTNSVLAKIMLNMPSLMDLYKQQQEEIAARRRARKDTINKIVKIAKPVGFVLLIILTAIITLFVGWGIYWCIIHANWMKVGEMVLKVFILVAIIFLVGFIIIKSPEIKPCFRMKILKTIAKPFVWLGKGIGTIFSIIFQMVKNNCPAIKWE